MRRLRALFRTNPGVRKWPPIGFLLALALNTFRPNPGVRNGVVIGFFLILALALATAPFILSRTLAERTYGRVTALGVFGKRPALSARVAVEGKTVWVRVYRIQCAVGDPIELYRHTTVLGSKRYVLGARGCVRV